MSEIRTKSGRIVEFAYDDDVAELFLDTVPDPVARSILFDTPVKGMVMPDSMDLGGYEIVKVMRRIVNVAFTVALCRWKQLYDEADSWPYEVDKTYFFNSRFTKIFQSAIGNEDITVDLQVFSLIELWVSLNLPSAPSCVRDRFCMIFDSDFAGNGDSIGLVLQAARDAIKNATFKRNGDPGVYTKEECNRRCYRLLRAFLFLRVAEFTYPEDNRLDDDKDFSVSYPVFDRTVTLYPNTFYQNGKLIATRRQLLAMRGNTVGFDVSVPLYMLTEISAFDGKSQLIYRSFDGEAEARVEAREHVPETDISDIIEGSPDLKETRKFLSFNYKNIRELAIVINDAIKATPRVRRELFAICEKKYPKIIADIKDCDAPNIYWDNIITLMLVEMGFSDFLELILKDESIFFVVMQNIRLRCIGRTEANTYLEDYHKRVADLDFRCRNNRTTFNEECVDLRVRTVLKAMKFDKEESWRLNPFEESLPFKYENIQLCIKTLQRCQEVTREECDEGVETLLGIFRNIFLFLQIFYTGLDRYAETKIRLLEQKQPKIKDEDAFRESVRNRHKACNEAFTEAAQKKYDEIKGQSLTEVFNGFCDLCRRYNSFAENDCFNISPEAKRLNYLITRNYICDIYKLQQFASITLADGTPSTIFEMLEHFSKKYYADPSYGQWLTYFYDVFFFLIYNEDYSARGLYAPVDGKEPLRDKDCDPIYPYIVTYYKENIDRDNLKKCTYRVPMPVGGSASAESTQGFVVTLLTEENYPPNTYYCIPLRYGSSESWWINPFLIPKFVVGRLKTEEKKEDK